MLRNEYEDNFDCFRYWEIWSFGVEENILQILPFSKTPKLPIAKATKRIHNEVIDKELVMKTMSLRWIVCAVSLGGLLFGFDAGVISGCEEAIQNEFKLAPFWHGLVVAGALIGTVFGALVAGRMCDRFGRKPTLVWMGVLFLISAA